MPIQGGLGWALELGSWRGACDAGPGEGSASKWGQKGSVCAEAAELRYVMEAVGVGVPALSGIQHEAWPQGKTWQLPWALDPRVRGLWLLAEVFGGGREAEGQTLGYLVRVGSQCSLFLLHTELSECQGKLQELHRLLQNLESLHRIPSAPVIPTHQVRAAG